MPKKRTQNQRGKQQRAMQKRSRRKTKLTRRAVHEAATERPERVLRRAREFPFAGCWVQQGWQDYGIASLVVARTQSDDDLVFGRFLVDTFCLGVKDAFFGVNVPDAEFHNEALPRLFSGGMPVPIGVELAHEIVYGAVKYAEANGFRPHPLFRRAQLVLDLPDVHESTGVIQFGHQGVPTYIAAPGDNEVTILNTLISKRGKGAFKYIPAAAPPEGFEDLVERRENVPERSGIWTPQQQSPSRDTVSDSGLWTPGQDTPAQEPSDGDDEAEQQPADSSLWVPGR
ncbi:MAG: hypothetical protein QGG34_05205 [SAR202 cluster bacterium]|jgi:hypothetical protein|nr:hypothetical protein [SAR202 cluster bacterium]MDP7102844.1 hypothetical protein [SAR202 cluster bacterium]MDP7224324.1 hypothetical protein [SAR202 cluster bacterium]MDP7413331.1 hypothetical protein [SAR202 cluster bacterium]|tara:strand:- start:327 stop:1181 length:855 start_codon:yes stop_codon:yes gene_type:complete